MAHILEYLVGREEPPPWVKALAILPVLGLFFWVVASQRFPTKAEDATAIRSKEYRVVVRQKRLNARHELVLVIENGSKWSKETDEYRSFFPPQIAADTSTISSFEAYRHLQQYSLNAYVVVGDSLLKKAGSLAVQLKRGNVTRTFLHRSLYP